MKLTLIISTCLFSFVLLAQPLSLDWVKQMGGDRFDSGNLLKTDPLGNIYLAGGFQDVADFDPGSGVTNLTGQSVQDWVPDAFIGKYDPDGNLIWVKGFTGTIRQGIQDIALDVSGNILAYGMFTGTVQFGPDPLLTFSTPTNIYQNFITKLDAGGNILWVKVFGHSSDPAGIGGIGMDQYGNFAVTGIFTGTGDFDPGMEDLPLTATGYSSTFIAKFDPDGEILWALPVLDDSMSYGICLEVDPAGNIYASGAFIGTIDLDPGPGMSSATALGGIDTYLLKLDPDGNLLWGKHFGGTSPDQATTLDVSAEGNIYLTGVYADANTDLDPGPEEFIPPFNGWVDFYVMKLDQAGNFVWAKSVGGLEYDRVWSVLLDEEENLYVSGQFRVDVDFDPGPETYMMSSLGSGSDEGFMMRMDQSGNFIWAAQLRGNMDYINAIDFSPDGGIYATGNFGTTADFDPTAGIFNAQPFSGYPDVFLFKWTKAEDVGVTERLTNEDVLLFPNPFRESLTIRFANHSANASLKLFNNLGELILQQADISENEVLLNTKTLSSGAYVIELQDGNAVSHLNVVK